MYTIHETIGHLGIFVSSGVARKEHGEFASNIDLIDVLPPGLYEAVFEAEGRRTPSADLVDRRMDHALRGADARRHSGDGGNNADDERRFAAAARVSEINLALYRTFAQPMVRAMTVPAVADMDATPASVAGAVRNVLRRDPGWPRSRASPDKVREDIAGRPRPHNSFLEFERTGMIGIALIQIPLLAIAANLEGWAMLAAALAMMLAVFGQIPLNDSIVGRYVADEYRARVLSVRYVVSLGVAAVAVPLIAVLHRTEGGFGNASSSSRRSPPGC